MARADLTDAEVVDRVRRIRRAIVKAEFPRNPLGKPLALVETQDSSARAYSLALHPDGRHWAAVAGRLDRNEVVLGKLTALGPRILRRIPNRVNGPVAVCFSGDGSTLFVGNANTTIGVYREAAAVMDRCTLKSTQYDPATGEDSLHESQRHNSVVTSCRRPDRQLLYCD